MTAPINHDRRLLMSALLALAAPITSAAKDNEVLQRFGGASSWLNSPPLGAPELRGKVVLVDFWTYTCINWLRTLPYVRAWAEKYRSHGLIVVGAHTPEFAFEKNLDNVQRAVRDMRLVYPVAVDNEFAIWRAFSNKAWPAVYLVDQTGRVRYSHLGEGEYEQTERMIQQLLAESGAADVPSDLVAVKGQGAEAAPDWDSLRSPETYLGRDRTENRSRGAVTRLRLNEWTLSGGWKERRDAVALVQPGGRIAFRFHARDLHLVMGAAVAGSAVRFRVMLDSKPPAADNGTDVDAQGNGKVAEQRLYQLLRQASPVKDRLFEIEFLESGVEAFAFTFG